MTSPGEELRARIAAMPHGKVEAYRKFRTPSRDNIMTKFYFENRLFRRGVPFLVAPPRARDFRYPPPDNSEVLELKHGKLKWEEDGFDLVASVVSDDTQADLDYLGELFERESRAPNGAIPMEKREVHGEWMPKYWFKPQLDLDGERKAHRGDSTRNEAWLRAQHTLRWDYNRLREFGQYWWTVGVVVKAYKNGIKLGESSHWGIESDSHEYHLETAKDAAFEALKEAKETLKKLQVNKAEEDGKILKTYVVEGVADRVWINRHRFPGNEAEEAFHFAKDTTYYVTETIEKVAGRKGGPEILRIMVTSPMPLSRHPTVALMDITRDDFDKLVELVINKPEPVPASQEQTEEE